MEYREVVFFAEQMVRLGMTFELFYLGKKRKGRIIARLKGGSGGKN